MKKSVKALLLVACAIVLVVATVFTTLAFLQDTTQTLTNTFSIGKVSITLKETKVNMYGQAVDAEGNVLTEGSEPVYVDATDNPGTNDYKIVPGTEYIKNPFVTVAEGSETSFVYIAVKDTLDHDIVESGLEISDTEWTYLKDLADGSKVYYYKNPVAAGSKLDVFSTETFTIKGDLGDIALGETQIAITAYAIQAENLDVTTAFNEFGVA